MGLLLVASITPAALSCLMLLGKGQDKKTQPARLLDNPTRKKIVDAIRRMKGLNETRLAKEAGLARGTLRHHLTLLSKGGVISKVALGRELHYFLNGADAHQAETIARVRHGRAWDVLRIILVEPGIRQKDLAERLSMTRKVLGVHLRVLMDGLLVQEFSRGRMRRYYPGQKIDGKIWGLFGLEKPVAEVRPPGNTRGLRATWFQDRGF